MTATGLPGSPKYLAGEVGLAHRDAARGNHGIGMQARSVHGRLKCVW